MSHIRITGTKGDLALGRDFEMDYEDVNPIFNDNVQSGSYPINVPINGNRQRLKNIDDIHTTLRAMDFEHEAMQIYIDGVPVRSGELVVTEDQELADNFDATIYSYIRSLDDLIADLNCQDIDISDDEIQIGECIGDVTLDYLVGSYPRIKHKRNILYVKNGEERWVDVNGTNTYNPSKTEENRADEELNDTIENMPSLGFSVPHEYQEADIPTPGAAHARTQKESPNGPPMVKTNFINTNAKYPDAKYCNARVCYTNYKIDGDGTTSDNVDKSAPFRVLEANRPSSGINLYVLYFIKKLFQQLNISYEDLSLQQVEDLCRLAFFTTHCCYDTVRKYPSNNFDYDSIAAINLWLSEREDHVNITTGKILDPELDTEPKIIEGSVLIYPDDPGSPLLCKYDKDNEFSDLVKEIPVGSGQWYVKEFGRVKVGDKIPVNMGRNIWSNQEGQYIWQNGYVLQEVTEVQSLPEGYSGTIHANIMKMYANSKNFPDASVSSVIESLWNSFGIKFILDYEQQKVTPILIRDVFRSQATPRKLHGKVLSITPVAEKISGVRMRYAAEADPKDQSKNVRDGVRDYDTAYDYLMSASVVNHELTYEAIKRTGSNSNTTCYLDRTTGNAYRWKVDKNAATIAALNLALFEVASYKGISIGDCSKQNEDYIVDLTSDFEPVIFTDTNGRNDQKQLLAAFVDEKMNNAAEKMEITYALGTALIDFPLTVEIRTNESYDPSSGKDGESPLQAYDWGLSVAVMRGGGSDATIQYYDYNYDGQGNSKYRMVSGDYAMTSDSMDCYGNGYDYNGVSEGDGGGERFSLKITAWKHDENGNPLTDGQGNILCNDDEYDQQGNITRKIRSRGLYDSFMSEYVHFLMNRKKYNIRMLCSVAELAEIPNHWAERFQIHNLVGWINKVKSHVSQQSGLGEVELEFYAL